MASASQNREGLSVAKDNARSTPGQGSAPERKQPVDLKVSVLRRAGIESNPSPTSSLKHWDSISKLQKNENGGVAIDQEEIQAAFEFLDVSDSGEIDKETLQKMLSPFFPDWTDDEYSVMMSEFNGKVTVKALKEFLVGNELTNFDPIREAFKVYDPSDTGFVSADVLKSITTTFGYGAISNDDLESMIAVADMDGDSRISLDDFRALILSKGKKPGFASSLDRWKSE